MSRQLREPFFELLHELAVKPELDCTAPERAVGLAAGHEDRLDGAVPRPTNAGYREPLLAPELVLDQ